jgi:hypothetical protein
MPLVPLEIAASRAPLRATDLVTIDDDNAKIEIMQDGFDRPVSLAHRSATGSMCSTRP